MEKELENGKEKIIDKRTSRFLRI